MGAYVKANRAALENLVRTQARTAASKRHTGTLGQKGPTSTTANK